MYLSLKPFKDCLDSITLHLPPTPVSDDLTQKDRKTVCANWKREGEDCGGEIR